MPCYSPPMTEEERKVLYKSAYGVDLPDELCSDSEKFYVAEINKLTRLLCFVCKGIESGKLDEQAPELQELHQWWERHKKWDAEREAK